MTVWNQADASGPSSTIDVRTVSLLYPMSGLAPGSWQSGCIVCAMRLQCAYHGWQFESITGQCIIVPQQPDKVAKARPVASYPTSERAGLLWVWTDPATATTLLTTIPHPVNPLLDRYIDHFGNDACYMRHLLYGMEILGENLVDLSHLPFAHHSAGGLKRDLGGELPTKILSQPQKVENAAWEKDYHSEDQIVLPTFQAEILEAAKHDPIMF